jgi:hypothetical protein
MAGPRESIWSVTQRTRFLYFATFSILVTISVILVAIYETSVNDKDTLYDTWKAIWDTSSRMAPAWVVISLTLAEVGDWTMVLAEMFREKRRRDQERRVKEAASQGRVEGRAMNQAQWLDWLKRREEAEKNNLPFNEPPPSFDDSKNGSIR